jgi:7-cyano-7-deazaguanine synthase
MIALAAAYADSIGASTIWVGANADDYEGYPDCRPQYFEAFNLTLERGTVSKPTIQTPLVNLKKAEIVGLGDEYGVDFSNTWSCYNPKGDFHCGQCDSCRLRKSAFRDAGVTDPTLYAT